MIAVLTTFVGASPQSSVQSNPAGDQASGNMQLPPVIAADTAKDIDQIMLRGLLSSQSGNDNDAKAAFIEVIALDPRNADAWYYRGMSEYRLNQSDAAIESFDRALEIDPDYYHAWYGKSLVYHQKGDWMAQSEAIGMGLAIEDRLSGQVTTTISPETTPRASISFPLVCISLLGSVMILVMRKEKYP